MKLIFKAGGLLKIYFAVNMINLLIFSGILSVIADHLFTGTGLLILLLILVILTICVAVNAIAFQPGGKVASFFRRKARLNSIYFIEMLLLIVFLILFLFMLRADVEYGVGQWELGKPQIVSVSSAHSSDLTDFICWNLFVAALSCVLILLGIDKLNLSDSKP